MKEITLPSHIFMHTTGDEPVNVDAAIQHATQARRNANTVISASLFVEREIEALVNNYLYPDEPASEQKTFVAAHILGSDALSFAAKRRIVIALARHKSWLVGKDADDFDQLLVKVGKFRNALTHGDVIERDQTTILKYFESSPREQELTDKYWDGIVATFSDAIRHVERIKAAAQHGHPTAA